MHEPAFNGIDGTTGRPLFTEDVEELARLACGRSLDPRHLEELRLWNKMVREEHLDTCFGVDPCRLDEVGWGVVFAHDTPEEVREALRPLLELRRSQAGRRQEHYYRELVYSPGQSKQRFLAGHGVGVGPVDPEYLPYYLLLVGDPEEIPFRFQYQLDVQYAVGRISFETAEEYASYAASVVAAEKGRVLRPRRMAFFGVANEGDAATRRSYDKMVLPLVHRFEGTGEGGHGEEGDDEGRGAGWQLEHVTGGATKASLARLLGGDRTPAFLFTASHGVGFNFAKRDPRQRQHQGALLCEDWPGPGSGPLSPEHYLSADDIGDGADLSGLVAFHFACFGAGTPRDDGFAGHRTGEDRQRASRDFVARLPQRLLGHPRGGALAVVGHVDRAWTYSFDWPRAGSQVQVFENAFKRLLAGWPVGAAMEYFGQRYAELASDLNEQLEEVDCGVKLDLLDLSGLWTAHNDARSYVVLGDPAVRLPGN